MPKLILLSGLAGVVPLTRPFKFEAVLNHRQHLEETARKIFADAVRELRQAENVLSRMENKHTQYQHAMRLKQANSDAAMELILYSRYLTRLEVEIREQKNIIDTLANDKEEKRRTLMVTLKDRKAIEKLKERHVADAEKSERDSEQKLLNDVAISRYQRQQ